MKLKRMKILYLDIYCRSTLNNANYNKKTVLLEWVIKEQHIGS
jgi:hypothetical protein